MRRLTRTAIFALAALLLGPLAASAQDAPSEATGMAAGAADLSEVYGACPMEDTSTDALNTVLSLYNENYKNEDYRAALPDLRTLLACSPAYWGPGVTSDNNIQRAIKIYDALAEEAEGEARTALLDTALMLYDHALPVLEEAGEEADRFRWTFNKGYFIQQHQSDVPSDAAEPAMLYRAAYDIAPDQLQPYYVRFIVDSYFSKGQTDEALAFLSDIQERFPENADMAGIVNEFVGAIPPEDRIPVYERRLEADASDKEAALALLPLYQQTGQRDAFLELASQMRAEDPSPQLLRTLAQARYEDANYEEALDIYSELQALPEYEPRAEDFFNIGNAQQQLGRFSSARASYREALDINPDFAGRAYLAIGDLYVKQVSNCGSLEREDRAVYWLATDYYQRAKNADERLSGQANQKINTYRQYYPSAEDLFFWEKTAGDSYRVDYGCYSWIGETTTVRG